MAKLKEKARGDYFVIKGQLTKNGQPDAIAGRAITVGFANAGQVVKFVVDQTNGVNITDDPNGLFTVTVSSTNSASLAVGNIRYDAKFLSPGQPSHSQTHHFILGDPVTP